MNDPQQVTRRESLWVIASTIGLLTVSGCSRNDSSPDKPDSSKVVFDGSVQVDYRIRDSGSWLKATSKQPCLLFMQGLTAYKGSITCTDSISLENRGEQELKLPEVPKARYVQIIRKAPDDTFKLLGLRYYSNTDRESAQPRLAAFMEAPGHYLIQGFTSYKPPPRDAGHTWGRIDAANRSVDLTTNGYFSSIQVVKVKSDGSLEAEMVSK